MNDTTTHGIRIRPGSLADAPAILDMLDSAVVWMNARGNTEQWGTRPYSQKPGGVARVERYTTENTPYIAELDGAPVGALVLDSGPRGCPVDLAGLACPGTHAHCVVVGRRLPRSPSGTGGAPTASTPSSALRSHAPDAAGPALQADDATLKTLPSPQVPITPAEEPERYVRLLVSDRRHAGLGIGAALLAHAAEETRRGGVELLRVDCWAGGGGELVAFYERNGFRPTDRFLSGDWPGQVLARRVG
ncbi:GNAT family N-acetyltransferase [Streptomyces formicae]|uniref:GNAT family N-acetyltransferase n=1 Tax=Streptomyces formicae TaxID=1616117 RepID=A0ABY3WL70_9ACTN|nr:GNAT family N-acetyltransferase [Streptomyces formicae]UNM12082.1 GNAT family N-acetyltransferase [Streptomyces formicae]